MRELVETQGATLPFAGVKSSDIDIGACKNNGETIGNEAEFKEKVCPLLKQATESLGYDFNRPNSAKISVDNVHALQNEDFYDDHYISYAFTETEARRILGDMTR